MITVQDIMNQNESQPIEIRASTSRDTCQPMRETIYTGQLKEIPAELRGLEVLETGWSYTSKVNVLTVYSKK